MAESVTSNSVCTSKTAQDRGSWLEARDVGALRMLQKSRPVERSLAQVVQKLQHFLVLSGRKRLAGAEFHTPVASCVPGGSSSSVDREIDAPYD